MTHKYLYKIWGGGRFPRSIVSKLTIAFFVLFFSKFLVFDLIWCVGTTFSSFSYLTTYLSKLLLSMILILPLVLKAPRWTVIVIAFAMDLFLISNLLYFRTYYTIIPLESYGLLSNMKDFTDSIRDSLRLADLFFPLSTLITVVITRHCHRVASSIPDILRYGFFVLLFCGLTYSLTLTQGGFRKSYEQTLINRQMSATPIYSIFGSLGYETLRDKVEFTPELAAKIEDYLIQKQESGVHPPIIPPHNIVIIIAESFESWVLEQSVEGREITPCLNRLLQEQNVLYAPKVQTQVKGGHSIDAQLMLTTGLLPIDNGCFSARYPYSTYPSLAEAFKQQYPDARRLLFTPDNSIVWNQMIVTKQFRFDTLIARDHFHKALQTGSGHNKRLADGPFFTQCLEKLAQPDLVAAATHPHLYVQCITYSGHAPFIIPEPLRLISFSDNVPERMSNYMIAANYTDSAIGQFIDSLRRMPVFDDTMIVITGDHEGLASNRQVLVDSDAGRNVVSPDRFTPLIILNSPVAMRYEKVLGQIDLYPTLLELLGLQKYDWHGLGYSILGTNAPPVAIDQHLNVIGDISAVTAKQIEHMKETWHISDCIIRSDYFGKHGNKLKITKRGK